MFSFFKKRTRAIEAPVIPIVPPVPTCDEEAPPSSPHTALLQRWMSLATMQQRVIHALAGEINRTSSFVETEADSLSLRFQGLAIGTQQQTVRVDSLTNLAMGVDVDGKTTSIEQIATLLETALSDVVGKILLLSKDSMSMVYALDLLNANVKRIEACLSSMDQINRTTNMLALNARIEAERAGQAGLTFRVVADEVRELSKAMQTHSITMNGELKAIIQGITSGYDSLRKVATVDMTNNIQVKEQLDILLPALVRRTRELSTVVASAVKESAVISADVDGMVTGIQFQDRTKQRLEHVVDTLHVIGEAIEDLARSTAEAAPEFANTIIDTEWVKSLLSRYTMSDVRERFVAHLLDGKPHEAPENMVRSNAASERGSMDLF